jgi:hypothetical protein
VLIAPIINIGNINGYTVQLIQKASRLSFDEQEKLVKELNSISVDAFNKPTPMQETWERTVQVDLIYLIKKDQKILGYTTNDIMNIKGEKINYFSSALFKREIQQNGLYKKINELRLETTPTKTIMTRTQNPLVVTGFEDLCITNNYEFFPNGQGIPKNVYELAKQYSPEVDQSLVCKGVYGRALMDKTPNPDKKTQKLFDKLEIEKGDAVILMGIKR